MARFVKQMTYLTILLLTLGFLILFGTTWPSKTELCQDLESYLPKTECIRLEDSLEIVQRAFPEGEVSSSDIRGALGEYLHAEYPTSYGHTEEYYLSIRPIDYLFRYHDSYRFSYDSSGTLVAFSYDDF